MTRDQALDWLGLPHDANLNADGEQIVSCLLDCPAPVAGDDDSALRTFGEFLRITHERGIAPPAVHQSGAHDRLSS